MKPNWTTRAWNLYKRHGLVELALAANAKRHRLVPFRYRIALRRRINEFRYGPGAVTQPLRIYRVDPDWIRCNGPIFSHDKYIGTVRDGDWDVVASEITAEEMYRGLRERFAEGLDWEDTEYYELAEQQFDRNGEWLGYASLDAFESNRLPYLDRLYRDIEERGYRSQAELADERNDETRHRFVPAYHTKINEITCNIARDGELLLNNGIHRISIAKVLGLDRIPIQFVVRHAEWQRIRSAVAASENPTETAREYNVDPAHPDLVHAAPEDEDSPPVIRKEVVTSRDD